MRSAKTRFRFPIRVAAAALFLSCVAAVAPETNKYEGTVIGRPPQFDKQKLGRPRFSVWNDADGWHVYARTGGKPHNFSGTIKVVGGKIYDLDGVGGLEKKKDAASLNGLENALQFRFKTFDRGDGLDFKVSRGTTRIEFDLQINGYPRAGEIDIGPNAGHPPTAHFWIPLMP